MSDWPSGSVRLDSLADVNPESLSASTPSGFSFFYIDISAVATGTITLPDVRIERRDAPSRAQRVLRCNDVLMATVRPNLKAFALFDRSDADYIASTGFAVIRSKNGHDGRFILHSLLSDTVSREVDSHSVGSNYPAINSSDVRRLSLPKFFPAERRVIADVISMLDTQIEATEALIAKQERVRAGLMQDLFTRGVDEHGQLRPPRQEAPHLYRQTELGWLPKGWDAGSILRYCTEFRQPILTGPFGADLGSADFVSDGIPLLRIGNVQDRHLRLDDLLFVSERKAHQLSKYRINLNDLLFARQGATTGRNALANQQVDGALINYHIIRVSLDPTRCNPRFIEAMFNSWLITHQIEQSKGRGTREGINTQQITSLRFPGPEVAEQNRIAAILDETMIAIETMKDELTKIHLQKSGLMQDLLTGKISVAPLLESGAA